jgi:hypothetical protein
MLVSCGGYFNYPPDIQSGSVAIAVTLDDGAFACGGTASDVYYTDGWVPLIQGSVRVARDNPSYFVDVFFLDRPFRAGMGLDGLFVVASDELGLPTCTAPLPAPTDP